MGVLFGGIPVIIPSKLRNKVLNELHAGHVSIIKVKWLSQSFFWWPGLDSDTEEFAKRCSGCQINQKSPSKSSLHLWEWLSTSWEHIHIDFAGPFVGCMFLLAVDAHSKCQKYM